MKRIRFLRVMWGLGVLVILARLFMIQIFEHEKWMKVASQQHVMQSEIPAKRGRIFMMDGDKPVPVVMNSAEWTVAVDPKVVNEEKVITVMEKNAKDFLVVKWDEVFRDKTRRYFVVAKNVPFKVKEKIREEKIAGVWMLEKPKRTYVEGEMASRLLGFVNAEGNGQYGVEGAMNKKLAGKKGLLRTIKDVNGVPLTIGDDRVRVPAVDGEDVYLSIDRNIQNRVEKILTRAMEEHKAEGVSAVVMDPMTGEILAMANVPNYNPADFGKVKDASAYINRVTESPYEPASVAKAFVMAAGIEEEVMNPETKYRNDGYVIIDGWPIKNAYEGMKGVISMQDALNYSLNTGSIEALRLLGMGELNVNGRKKLYDYYVEKFGLSKATGVELFESGGLISSPIKGDGRNSLYANMTFGQNMNVTMMQVVNAYAAMVNGGERVRPSIIAQKIEKVNSEEKKKRILSEKTSRTMRNMLFVTRRGARMTGLDREGFFVGGKTGTAQVIRDGKYTLDETVATYVGFGGRITVGDRHAVSLEKERGVDGTTEYLVMVRIEGAGKRFGGEMHAKPIFDKISNYMQDYLRIQPK